jgi:hypothetical protein
MNDSAALAALTSQLIDEIGHILDPDVIHAKAAQTGTTMQSVTAGRALWIAGILEPLRAGTLTPQRLAGAVGVLRTFRQKGGGAWGGAQKRIGGLAPCGGQPGAGPLAARGRKP